jgi:hypothetical protein
VSRVVYTAGPRVDYRAIVQSHLTALINEATIDKIWKTVENVWNETFSSEVARAFVLAYRVMNVIIKEDGNNDFLSNGTPHCNVRKRISRSYCTVRYSTEDCTTVQ